MRTMPRAHATDARDRIERGVEHVAQPHAVAQVMDDLEVLDLGRPADRPRGDLRARTRIGASAASQPASTPGICNR
jgi:hypothetical protein